MKKAIKTLAAITMAFTLLGTGTAISNVKNIHGNNSIVAQAGKSTIRVELRDFPIAQITTYKNNGKDYAKVVNKGGLTSFVAPNFKAKSKRNYRYGETFLVRPKMIWEDKFTSWIMTTSGYYVPIAINVNSVYHTLNWDPVDRSVLSQEDVYLAGSTADYMERHYVRK